jgi:DNA (cytosine-5)-methyltransferase 1
MATETRLKPLAVDLFCGLGGWAEGFLAEGYEVIGFDIEQVEKEPFCLAVLRTAVSARDEGDGYSYLPWVDLICAGVPCQDVPSRERGLGSLGKRTGLFYEFARILQELRPAWFLFENVPGLLSSNKGRDFAEVQRVLMVECGYGICWRVLDSQFFGVAQRRSRLFIVGCFGKPCPAEVLFERESGAGDSQEGRGSWSRTTAEIAESPVIAIKVSTNRKQRMGISRRRKLPHH